MKPTILKAFTALLTALLLLSSCGMGEAVDTPGDPAAAETSSTPSADTSNPNLTTQTATEAETVPTVQYSQEFGFCFGHGEAELAGYMGKEEIVYTPPIATYAGESAPVTGTGNETFRDNSYVKEVYFTEGITEMGNELFWNCQKLRKVVIPEGVTTMGCRVFADCGMLEEVILPESLLHIGYDCFENSRILKDKTLWENGERYIDDVLVKVDNSKITGAYTVKEKVRVIAGSAFGGNTGLTSVAIPGNVLAVGTYAFRDCQNIKSLTLEEGILYLDYGAFLGCEALESVSIPDSVVAMGDSVFAECRSLQSVRIPPSVTRIERHAFFWCDALAEVTLHENITYIGDEAFYGTQLTELTLPATVTYIGYNAFAGCTDLKQINFEGTQEQWNAIEKGYQSYYAYGWRSGSGIQRVVCTDGTITFD